MTDTHHQKKLDLNLLAVFDALAREGSVTRAAESLDLTQSAASHALRRLRSFFDDPLFIKLGDGMKPTPKGEALAATVLDIMGRVNDQLLNQQGFDPLTATRTFKLCMTDLGELVFLPKLIQEFERQAPNCRIQTLRVRMESITEVLESGEADLAMGAQLSVGSGLFRQELFAHRFVCMVSRHNHEFTDKMDLERFKRMKHIVINLSGKLSHYDQMLDDQGIHREVFLLTPHYLVIPMLLENNPGLVATVPHELGRVFEAYGAVKLLDPPVTMPTFPICQYWHPRVQHDEANRWLRRLAKEIFTQTHLD